MNRPDVTAIPVSPAPLVRFTGVQKHYSRRFTLHIDDLTLCRYDRLLLIGANGSGKSSFLRALAGAITVNSGQLWRDPEWATLRIAYAPQSGGLYGELTVADNLAIRRSFYRWSHEAERSSGSLSVGMGESCVERLGIQSVLRTRVRALSGGLHRLVSLAAALHSEPDVLIVDEPFGDLDDRGMEAVRAVLSEVVPKLTLFVAAMPMDAPSLPVNRRLQMLDGRPVYEPAVSI